MSVAPKPNEIFERGVQEGKRRLEQSLLELVSNGFIAGFTIIFGISALGTIHAVLEPAYGPIVEIVGALAFPIGLVFLVVGRAELFSENFFDPVVAVVESRKSGMVLRLVRLWGITFVLNLVGGALFALILSVDGVLPSGTAGALNKIAEDTVGGGVWAGFAKAIAGGALVTLLSFLLNAVNSVGSRIAMAYMAGFLLSLGPFEHVIVAALYMFFGILFGAEVGSASVAETVLVVTIGNLLGGLGLVTLTHIAQAKGGEPG